MSVYGVDAEPQRSTLVVGWGAIKGRREHENLVDTSPRCSAGGLRPSAPWQCRLLQRVGPASSDEVQDTEDTTARTQHRHRVQIRMTKDENFKPGTFGCHEALHMASFLCDVVDRQLVEHEAIKQNKEWLKLAYQARAALIVLYNEIGKEHL